MTRTSYTIPSGSVVQVLRWPSPDDRRLVDVTLDDRTLQIFAAELATAAKTSL